MAIASQASGEVVRPLQELAQRHLWLHFSRMGSYNDEREIPIIVRADGCYVYDDSGNRYLDGLSGLFCVNAGHGRTELGEAAASPRWRPVTSTGSSSPPAARRRWSRR
jgi:adenosylmethionine-8-amino-7-oxononanoate aminotransferase